MSVDTTYLREQANNCVLLARNCSDVPVSHQLEEIAVELMARAAQLDELLGDISPSQ
jgi:hypothetical protein